MREKIPEGRIRAAENSLYSKIDPKSRANSDKNPVSIRPDLSILSNTLPRSRFAGAYRQHSALR